MKGGKASQSGKIISKVLKYIGRYRIALALSLLLALVSTVGVLYAPILVGDAIDLMLGKGAVDFDSVMTLIIKSAALAVIVGVLQWIMNMLNNSMTFSVVRDIRREAFSKLHRLELKYHDSHMTGETLSRIIADADQLADGLLMGFTQLFTGIVTIIGTLAFMLSINVKIALTVVVLTPLSLFVARFIARRTYKLFTSQAQIRGEQTSFIDEIITNQKTVKAFSKEKQLKERFADINSRLEKSTLLAVFFSSLTNPTTRFVNSVVYAFVALTGALAVTGTMFTTEEAFTIGALSCFLSYANQYTKPFNEISGVVTELQNAIACAGRIFELIEQPEETRDGENAVVLSHADGSVSLKDVSFSYDKSKTLIKNLNAEVKSGQRIAIVGPTGCGKTTLINLLMRFYDVDGGCVCVDGHDIRSVTRSSLRENYGMVLQETWLRSGTVRDNIALGREDASLEEIIEAAKQAHAHSFIRRLPDGYDTVIGDDGEGLSQGQKQLLCIARLMLLSPSMLILDEATSSIDTRTEQRIQKAFLKLMQGRTTFIVAHRLSTILSADLILVMKDGAVIEQGNHAELMEKGGFYAELYNSQFAK